MGKCLLDRVYSTSAGMGNMDILGWGIVVPFTRR